MADKEMVAATLAAAVYTRVTLPKNNTAQAVPGILASMPVDAEGQIEKAVDIYKRILAALGE